MRQKRLALFVVIILALLPVAWGVIGGFDKTDGGEVAVVRNGGVFDDNQVRGVIDSGSSPTWIGLWSSVHKYPAQQRFYTITSDAGRGDRGGVDVVNTPSLDGVDMGIEGTFYFSLNLDHSTLQAFDNKFGTRQFRVSASQTLYAWDGNDGWSAFLDQIIRPVIDNALRQQINNFHCSELVSSCALVQNSQGTTAPTTPTTSNNNNIAKVQDAINLSLAQDVKATLGGDFLTGIKFNLVKVTLPKAVQDAVNSAQAAFAKVTEAQAKVASAQAEADANKKRQDGYNACPACAQIDIMKAIPPTVTTYAPGANTSIPLK